MTETEVREMCKRMDIVFDVDHPDHITASKLKTLSPPFMEYFLVDNPVYADGTRYIDIKDLTIRIYSDTETSEAESNVKQVLEEEDLRWRRSSEYIEELMLWAIEYKTEV